MASSSSSQLDPHMVDESYFSALHDAEEVFPISDEKYAEELQLQEALISSSLSHPSPNPTVSTVHSCSSSSSSKQPLVFTASEAIQSLCDICVDATSEMFQNTKCSSSSSSSSKQPLIMTSPETTQSLCAICMDTKTMSEMFRNAKACSHFFCTDCIRGYVAGKIKENVTKVKCPDLNCEEVIGPQDCESIVPKEVLERWESILCESLIMGCEKFYCPFKDCSAMMVDDSGVAVTVSECPNCNRLFCAQCKVAWHCGMSCSEFEISKKSQSHEEDNMLIDLAKIKKWMRCSKCMYFVERVDGCLHMSCRCGHQFCYGCGKAYSGTHVCATV